MPIPDQPKCNKHGESNAYLNRLRRFQLFAQLDTKLARTRSQDTPVLYAEILPGLDVLLCPIRGAQAPYPDLHELRLRCIESIANALEQPLDGLDNGGYWYEANGIGFLVFTSRARPRILPEFGALSLRKRGSATSRERR